MEKKLQIMVIDDEPIVGKRLKQALTKFGIDVETFEDPEIAMDQLNNKSFDIVVTDIRMDKVDGIQILERVLQHGDHSRVIIITGYATMEVAQEAMAKGAFDFIAKPFKPNDLRAAINKAALSLGFDNIINI